MESDHGKLPLNTGAVKESLSKIRLIASLSMVYVTNNVKKILSCLSISTILSNFAWHISIALAMVASANLMERSKLFCFLL